MVSCFEASAPMVVLGSMAAAESADPHSAPTKALPPGLPHTLELSGGILILARVTPSEERDFAQILLPVAMSHETFLCKLCVALGVQKESVKKVLKLPDILIRTTEDVVRLENWDKLEIRLKRKSPLRTAVQKMRDLGRATGPSLCGLLLVLYLGALFTSQSSLQCELSTLADSLSSLRAELRTNLSGPGLPPRLLLGDGGESERIAADVLRRLNEGLGKKLEALEKGMVSLALRIKETKALVVDSRTCARK